MWRKDEIRVTIPIKWWWRNQAESLEMVVIKVRPKDRFLRVIAGAWKEKESGRDRATNLCVVRRIYWWWSKKCCATDAKWHDGALGNRNERSSSWQTVAKPMLSSITAPIAYFSASWENVTSKLPANSHICVNYYSLVRKALVINGLKLVTFSLHSSIFSFPAHYPYLIKLYTYQDRAT